MQPIPVVETQQNSTKNATQKTIQIVRSDGRVVILPPIEKPATRSSKKKQEPEQQQQPTKAPPTHHPQQPQPVQVQQHVPPTAPVQKYVVIVMYFVKYLLCVILISDLQMLCDMFRKCRKKANNSSIAIWSLIRMKAGIQKMILIDYGVYVNSHIITGMQFDSTNN